MKKLIDYQPCQLLISLIIVSWSGNPCTLFSQAIGDFQINENTDDSNQTRPFIASDGKTNFVAVWQDRRNGNWDIYGQLYDANGIAQGYNFKVTDDVNDRDQLSPAIAMDDGGNFVVVWRDDGDHSFYGQRYSNNATQIGDNFKISEMPVPSYENHPAIGMGKDGSFVVAWHDNYERLYCQRYDTHGVKLGSNSLVDGAGRNQFYPAIAIDENGYFILVWGDRRSIYGDTDVYLQRFDLDGIKVGSSIKVNEASRFYQSDPRIDIDTHGNFVVAWEDARNEYDRSADIYGQRFNSGCNPIGINFKVNDNVDNSYQASAAIAIDKNSGDFLVVWTDYRNGSSNSDVYGQFFSSDGQTVETNFRINNDAGIHIQDYPDVKWVNNRVYMAWADNRVTGQGDDVFAHIEIFNSSPTANAGIDQTVEATSQQGAEVTLNGSGSDDPDTDQLTYIWRENNNIIAGPANNPSSIVLLSLGRHVIELTVDDGKGRTSTDEVIIYVVDTTLPNLDVSLSPEMLWPPNHKMVAIQATVNASDICDPAPSIILMSILSNESDDGISDGDKANDIQYADLGTLDLEFQLRAERSGVEEGRVYTVKYSATDASGNMILKKSRVIVSHDKGQLGKSIGMMNDIAVAQTFALFHNFPNPFNPTTVISYALSEEGVVIIQIYDIQGHLVKTLVDEHKQKGVYSVEWNATDDHHYPVSSGIYICQMKVKQHVFSRKLILIQ